MFNNVLIYTLIVCNIFYANELDESNAKNINSIGIGLEFTLLPQMFSNDIPASIYIPMRLKGSPINFIESEIIFFNDIEERIFPENNQNNYKDETSIKGIALGIYNSMTYTKKMNKYAGIKLGYLIGSETPYAQYGYEGKVETTMIIVSPTIGSEYQISKYFTIGGEIAMQIKLTKSDGDDRSNLSAISYSDEQTEYSFRPKFMIRFYF